MPKLVVEANELTDVKVRHISLVKRGAIKVPFRILKSEGGDEMLNFDLKRVFEKKAPEVPTVAAILVSKDADLDAAKARIEKAGFSVETQLDDDESAVVFPQVEGKLPAGVIVKMDDEVAVYVIGVAKAFEPVNLDSTSFGDVFAQEGMRPGLMLSMEALSSTVSNIMAKAENKDEFVQNLDSALNEFAGHVKQLAQAVPQEAFTLDFFKNLEATKRRPKAKDGEDEGENDPEPGADAEPGTKPTSKAEGGNPPAEDGGGSSSAGDGDGGGDPDPAPSGDDTAVAKALEGITKSLETITASVEQVSKENKALRKDLGKVQTVAEAARDAVKKTAVSAPPARDEGGSGDGDAMNGHGDPPLIDTAFQKVE